VTVLPSFTKSNSNNTDHAILNKVCSLIDVLPIIEGMRKLEIKVAADVGVWDEAGTISTISANPKLRAEFVQQVVDIVDMYQMDGVHLQWWYPGCPKVRNLCILSYLIKSQYK